jgi:hypothetical protein
MKTFRLLLCSLMLVALSALAASAQTTNPNVSCTDATATVCVVKKNAPFQLTNDPANPTATIQTEKWRLYIDGAIIQEVPNTGVPPVYDFPTGLSTARDYVFTAEAIGREFNAQGKVVTGNIDAPKNLRIIK